MARILPSLVFHRIADNKDIGELMEDSVKFIIDHLEGLAGSVAVIISLILYAHSSKDKKVEIYLSLFQQWDALWSKITAHPEQNKCLFQRNIKEIDPVKNEDFKFCIFQAITLLSRVHYYYQKTGQDIHKSDWQKEINFVMSKPLFISAYKKHQHRYSDEFNQYIQKSIPKENKVIEVKLNQKQEVKESK